jgi:AcrR family transcriptional regulator
MKVKRSKLEAQSERTRQRLLRAARRLFVRQGYDGTSTEDIVSRAGVTRGALYYQFEDKRALFRAVCDELARETAERIVTETMERDPPEEDELRVGLELCLDLYREPTLRRILVDAPAVLGAAEFQEIQMSRARALLVHALEHQVEAGWIPDQPLEPIARLLTGAIWEAATSIGAAEDPEAARAAYQRALMQLLDGFADPARRREPRPA